MTTTLTPSEILTRLAEYYQTDKETVKRNLFFRQIYTYCLRIFTDLSRKEIGALINKDGSVVSTTVSGIRSRCSVDTDFRNQIIEVEKMFE